MGSRRRIFYGIHGYGRGHAARAQAILPDLLERYDVRIFAGDDAYDHLTREGYHVTRIPVLRYYANPRTGKRSARLTIQRNTPGMLDQWLDGPIVQMVRDEIERFQPDVILSDSEGWTHRAGKLLGVPRISFDHYGIMAYCDLPLSRADRLIARAESVLYKKLVSRPERIIVVAFFEGTPRRDGVTVVGPILRKEVRDTEPTDGEHLLVYFTNAREHFTPAIEAALKQLDTPVKVYGPSREGVEGNVEFCPIGNLPFVRHLAGARGVFSTAGNQLCSEAIHFGKPLLLVPEEALEQRLNAQFIERWNAGLATTKKQITPDLLRTFLARCEEFSENARKHRRDGIAEALAAIDRAINELA